MKKIFLLGLVLCVVQSQAQISPIQREVNGISPGQFIKEKLFAAKPAVSISFLQDLVTEYSLLEIDRQVLTIITSNSIPLLEIDIPFEGNMVSLQLIQNRTVDNNAIFKTSDGRILSHNGIHYYGVIKGQANSLVSISFFNDIVMGFISNKDGDYSIGKVKMKNGQEEYAVFNDKDMKNHKGFTCATVSRDVIDHNLPSVPSSVTGTPEKCLSVYIVTDYPLYQKFGNDPFAVTAYATAIFNGMSSVYRNESITISMSSLYVYTTTDPYGTPTDIYNFRDIFTAAVGTSFGADLAHLLSARSVSGGQGIGWLPGLCTTTKTFLSTRIGLLAPSYTTPLPSEIALSSHEMGHDLGAFHTHTCFYGGLPLDGCGFVSGAADVCGSNPGLPVNGGTIMSYCDVVPGVGISLANGFGILPGNVIRATVTANSCSGTCVTTCNSNIIIDGANYIGSYYTQPLTESSTWIKTSGIVIVNGGVVKLDADVTGYVELNTGFETKAASSSSIFTAQAYNGCTTGSPGFTSKSSAYSNNKEIIDQKANEKVNSFSVYPNPATDQFTLVSTVDLQNATIELFDASGKLQHVQMQNTGKNSKKITVVNLSKGLYLIKLTQPGKTEFAKVIVQ